MGVALECRCAGNTQGHLVASAQGVKGRAFSAQSLESLRLQGPSPSPVADQRVPSDIIHAIPGQVTSPRPSV